jgi:TRAP-type C4-dicarboxylate transport system permease small subunit
MTSITKIAEAVSSILLALVFAIFVVAVFMRYVLHVPLAWADELTIILFSVLIFFASALALKPSQQVRFDVVFNLLPERVARYTAAITGIAFGLIFLAAFWPCLDYVLFMYRQRTPALNIPFFYVFVAFPCFLLAAGLRMIWGGVLNALGRAHPE